MRGKAEVLKNIVDRKRITPAYAGKSTTVWHYPLAFTDHPRLCGEKIETNQFTTSAAGSPPPMRGKVANLLRVQPDRRITPAYAGKRFCQKSCFNPTRDHPRLCGEK